MRLLAFLGVLIGGYAYFLMYASDLVLKQVHQINATYQYVADNSDQIASGR